MSSSGDGTGALTGLVGTTRIEVHGVSKRYGAQVALTDVDLRVEAGEIVAIVGENGAGKSTLAKVIGGVVKPDEGEVRIDGATVTLTSPRDGLAAGISYIPQELSYLPNMTVADNLLVGRWPSWKGLTNGRAVAVEAQEVARRFRVDLDVTAPLAGLRLADRQLVEILKCLARDLKGLILDEPTASLTADESNNLFRVLRQMRDEGVGIVFVSHRIDEVFEIADRIVVMRNGSVVGDVVPDQVTPRHLIELMLGSEIAKQEFARSSHTAETGEEVLTITNWSRDGLPTISNFSLSLRTGEVVGLFGQRGSGADLIADGLGGRVTGFVGSLTVYGKEVASFEGPRDAIRAGIVYLPPERQRDGLVLPMSVRENLTMMVMSSVARRGVIDQSRQRTIALALKDKLDIRLRTIDQGVDSLSGGNQQKVLLGSRLAAARGIVILNEPTRGVDVGARAEIHNQLREEARAGSAVLWITSDVEEAVLVSDRLIVLREGSVVGQLHGDQISQGQALALATGEIASLDGGLDV